MKQPSSIDNAAQLDPFEPTLRAFGRGQAVILVDDEDRENEGDITVATEFLTVELLALMTRSARGLVCVSIPRAQGERLQLPLQAGSNRSRFDTPFTVSVDHCSVRAEGSSGDGLTFKHRVHTMKRLADPHANSDEFISPGNVFPLMAHPAGVLGRRGQTEGAYDLARLSGLFPSGVICEVLNEDGSVARGEALRKFAAAHKLPIISVQQIIDYRIARDTRVAEISRSLYQTRWGQAQVIAFIDEASQQEHVALVFGDLRKTKTPLVRIHSECLTGDILGSERCDCGPQLDAAAQAITKAGVGVILYLRQEGRGIGLANKIKAYALQDKGADTVQANELLGLPVDGRSYAVAVRMLQALNVDTVRLLTNNPSKINQIEAEGIKVIERIALLPTGLSALAQDYLHTKQQKMGHLGQIV